MSDSGVPVENTSSNGLKWLSYALAALAIILCIIVYLLWHRTSQLSEQYDSLPSSGANQSLSLTGSELSLTGRNSVDLSSLLTNNKLQATLQGSDLTINSLSSTGATLSTSTVNLTNLLQPSASSGTSGAKGSTGATGPQGSVGVAIAQNGVVLAGSTLELGTNQLLHDTVIPQDGNDVYFDASTNNGSIIALGSPGVDVFSLTPGPGKPLSVSGPGERLIWYPKKVALRAGVIDAYPVDLTAYGGAVYNGNEWDDANIGLASMALGYNTVASGAMSTAIGGFDFVTGQLSSAFGALNYVPGDQSIAIGGLNLISGQNSVNIGMGVFLFGSCFNTTTGSSSFNVGICNTLGGNNSTIIGDNNTTVLGANTNFIAGNYNTSSAPNAFVIGNNNTISGPGFAGLIGINSIVSGSDSLGIGTGLTVNGNNSFLTGYNLTSDVGANNTYGINVDDTTPVTMSNANVIGFYGGNVGVNQTNPTHRFEVTDTSTNQPAAFTGTTQTCIVDTSGAGGWNCTSDARLKENIMDLSGSLDKLLQLQGVTYNFKSDLSGSPIAGFVAQEVQKILPSLVGQDTNGYLNLNKDGMIPYIVEAIKEQNGKIDGVNNQLLAQGLKLDSFSEQLKLLSTQVLDHEDRIKILEKQNADKEARIDALEKKVNQVPVSPVTTP